MPIPKQLTEEFFPGLGDQHVIGASGVGVHTVRFTAAANTVQTNAQIIASPAGASATVPVQVIVHSHGVTPSVIVPYMMGDVARIDFGINYAILTADNSAVYFRAFSTTGTAPAGVDTRMHIFR